MSFHSVYSTIYGSQISFLKLLNSGGGTDDPGRLRSLFDDSANKFPDLYKGDTYKRWLGFLENQGLVFQHENSVSITAIGREFLAFLARMGWNEYKTG